MLRPEIQDVGGRGSGEIKGAVGQLRVTTTIKGATIPCGVRELLTLT